MRILDLVKRLKDIYDRHGDLIVRVVDGEGSWGYAVKVEMAEGDDAMTEDEIVALDITAEPEPSSLPDTV